MSLLPLCPPLFAIALTLALSLMNEERRTTAEWTYDMQLLPEAPPLPAGGNTVRTVLYIALPTAELT